MLEAAAVEKLDYHREEFYDEHTLFRVFDSLREAGVDAILARKAIDTMHRNNILFRERKHT